MKAFVMAAGVGTRLRPLTYDIPKPMISIVNKPVMEHTLELLGKYGVKEVVISLHHQGEMIKKYFGRGSKWGLRITYSEEQKLMGTAGGVKKAEKFFDDTFLVMSGDGLTDIDLGKAIDFHRRKKSLATMVLKEVDARFEYGVVMLNKTGQINRFLEKPTWSSVFSNTVNTGIYIFEPAVFKYIPKNKFYDFGHDLWPLLLKKKRKIYGYQADEYWCDIGNLSEYRRAQSDVLSGKVRLNIPGEKIAENIWIGQGTQIDSKVKLEGPCIIGENCKIEDEVSIGKFTVVGNNGIIKQGASLRDCIVWDNVYIDRNVELANCIIGNSANIQESISVFEGSVINMINIKKDKKDK
ncbi:MAG: NDP-sugar synthase [bacterium]